MKYSNVCRGRWSLYGSRELRRVVETELESKIAEGLINAETAPTCLKAVLQDGAVVLRVEDAP